MKILFVTTDWNTPYRIATGEYGGISHYRAYAPAKQLRSMGHTVDIMGKEIADKIEKGDRSKVARSYQALFKDYDAVVIKQADTRNAGVLIGACLEKHIPIIMDLDDLITDVDKSNPAYDDGYDEGGMKRAMALAATSMVNALFVSTQPLKEEYQDFLKKAYKVEMPVYVLPNCIDADDWKKQKKVEDETIFVGWHGSITHDADLALVLPTMKKIMTKYPHVFFDLTGGITQKAHESLFKDWGDLMERVSVRPGTPSYKEFPAYISQHKWDIGIAPLVDNKFNRGKSHIKWMEYSLAGVPTIASKVYPYCEPILGQDVIIDGVTGLLAGSESEWEDCLELLIHDAPSRKYIARDARNYVLENWQYKQNAELWEQAFKECIE